MMSRPNISRMAPNSHGHMGLALNSVNRVCMYEPRTATVVGTITKNGPNTRANMRVRICEDRRSIDEDRWWRLPGRSGVAARPRRTANGLRPWTPDPALVKSPDIGKGAEMRAPRRHPGSCAHARLLFG